MFAYCGNDPVDNQDPLGTGKLTKDEYNRAMQQLNAMNAALAAGNIDKALAAERAMNSITGGKPHLVTPSQLKQMGAKNLNAAQVNVAIKKAGIITPAQTAMFLSTVAHESKTGLLERGATSLYRGAGYIQLTGIDNYRAYSIAVGDPKILSQGAEYVAANYAWDSAAWYWNAPGNNCNSRIASGASFYKISQVVNGGPTYPGVPNGWDDRKQFYDKAVDIFR